ncbi:MAG: RluA family pseudouridine synthase [Clostridiales bacterium]|nr:RluA family pseudouridine synthase [Clostridiales bacterium]
MSVEIVYEDNHLLVAIKPHNMPTQADSSKDMDILTYLKGYIKEEYNKPGAVYLGLVHRLDRPAAGLMVFARTSKAASRLATQLQNGELKKTYRAVIEGVPDDKGTFTDYLLKGDGNLSRVVKPGTPGAKQAVLHYQLIESRGNRSLVEVDLVTGRPHQIRVQFASRNMPLVGDARYGEGGRQLALYASGLSLIHPTKKERMDFTSDACDERFERYLRG